MLKRFPVFFSLILTFMSTSVFAVNVTLNVDMENATVSGDGVHVAGSFQGWDPAATALTDDDADGVYTVTIDMSSVTDDTVFFKYINGNAWGSDEGVSDPACGGAGGFGSDRWLAVPSEDTTLDPVCFSECIGCDQSYVDFEVDAAGFEITDGVRLAGGFNGWDATVDWMSDEDGDEIYEIRKAFTEGEIIEFKYVLNGDNWEDLQVDFCTTEGEFINRTLTITDDNMMMDPAPCFGSCYACGDAPVTANVMFQADMSVLLSQGWDGTVNTLELRGGMNGWGPGDVFEEDFTDPTLYTFTKAITAQPGSVQEWKFKASPDEDFNNTGWETAANRTFYFWGDDIMLAPEQPVILPIGDLANDVTVEIHATWMEGTLNVNNGEPFPQAPDTMIINGSFLNCWCTWGNCMGATCAEPVSADVPRLVDPDGDGVYVGSLSLTAGHGNVFTYKLGAYYPGVEDVPGDNGAMDNEAGFGADKTYYIATNASGTVVLETVFGSNNPANPFLPRTVTLNVDMNDEVVSEDGVHVAGSFQGWDPAATELMDPDQDGVYSVDIEANAGDTIYFKYINGNAWGSDEGVSDPTCGGAGGFGSDRWLVIPDTNTTLDPVCFGECIACDESYVTFHVDMAETEVSADGIFIGGGYFWPDFHAMEDIDGTDGEVYGIKVLLDEGATIQYKFNNGGNDAGYESGDNLGAGGCGVGDWNDRFIDVGDDDMMTPAFCFSACWECGNDPVPANVTFQADMSVLISQGWDPAVHFMELRGGMNGWAAGDVFQEDLTDPMLYTFTKEITAQVGAMQEWKFKANPDEDFNNGGWETAANRMFEFTGEDMTLEAAQPVILPIGDLENDVTVEIHATWMTGTLNANNGEPFPQAPDTMIINGSFLNCWCTWGNCMGATCAEPVSADVPRLVDPDGDGVYVGSLSLTAGHGNVFTYKLGAYYPGVEDVPGANGAMDNEAGFGADKTFFIATAASGTVVLETVFGDNNPENPWIGVGGMLYNGGFENGITSWSPYPEANASYFVEMTGNNIYGSDAIFEAYEGNYSLKQWGQYNGAENYGSFGQWLEVGVAGLDVGSQPTLSGMMFSHADDWIGQGINSAYLAFYYYDDSYGMVGPGWEITDVIDASSPSSEWLNRSVTGTVPEGTVWVWAGVEYYQASNDDHGSVYTDMLEMHISDGVSVDLDADLPGEFKILGNYPNPFNPVTKLRFDIDYRSNVTVTIYNILGNEVTTLQNGEMNPGRYSLSWNATNDQGQSVPTGMYLYKVTSDSRILTGKMLLMK